MTCERPESKTVWLMRASLLTVVVEDAALLTWLRKDTTRPTYLLFRDGPLPGFGSAKTLHVPDVGVIISKLRDIYGPKGAHFSVHSVKPGRTVICAWSCKETTPLESPPSPAGQAVS